jgi:trimeric autotransporter adhesin
MVDRHASAMREGRFLNSDTVPAAYKSNFPIHKPASNVEIKIQDAKIMKTNRRTTQWLALLTTVNLQLLTAFAQGTAFTYQGRLNIGTNIANGTYDLQFTMYDALANGNVAGGPLTNAATGVTNGLFTATLDFGAGVFTGADRWLQIGVRTNGSGTFVMLSPRQKLTPTPYAIYSANATTAGIAGGVVPGSVTGAGIASSTITSGNIAGGQVVKSLNGFQDAVTLSPGPNVSFTSGGNNIQIAASLANAWELSGNAGTTAGLNFVGTTDNQPLELRANSQCALRLEPNPSGAPNVVGGAPVNLVDVGTVGGVIGGGGAMNYQGSSYSNEVASDFGVIGGGTGNSIQTNSPGSTIGGGEKNSVNSGIYAFTAAYATIGGGYSNTADAINATIGGGSQNNIWGSYPSFTSSGSTIAGGVGNSVHDSGSGPCTIGGGSGNMISGGSADFMTIAGGQNNIIMSSGTASTIGGGEQNVIGNNTFEGDSAVTIAGGYNNWSQSSTYSTISGGSGNRVGYITTGCTVGGGETNSIGDFDSDATICGGNGNIIGGGGYFSASSFSTVGGGYGNSIAPSSWSSTVGGGMNNLVNGSYGTIPGGANNVATNYAFAAGQQAQALHQGSFVWADSQNTNFASTANDQVSFRCQGGVRFTSGSGAANQTVSWTPGNGGWSFSSDRNLKDHLEPVDVQAVLEKVSRLPIMEWNYKDYPQRHIGAMAQDFHSSFPLNNNDKMLNDADLHGVALAAIQGLNQKMEAENAALRAENADLKARLDRLEQLVHAKY